MRFKRIKLEKIYLQESICDEFKSKPLPNSIRKHRNIAIVLTFLQIVFSVASFLLYLTRRNRMVFGASIFAFLMTNVGFFGTITINVCMMLLHSITCVSMFGVFYFFLLLDAFLATNPP